MSIVAKQRLLIALSLLGIAAMMLAPPIPQDPEYHRFADQNSYLAIPNALNVLSNLLFLVIGVVGLIHVLRRKSVRLLQGIYPAYAVFFIALVLIALGSAYYHWSPDSFTLAWDRLAMTLAFMSFFTVLLAERVSLAVARRLFLPLLLTGVASIVYWQYGESGGHGDLRLYALVQFLPLLLTPFILLAFASRFDRGADLWWLLAWYIAAKLCELFDHELYAALNGFSGHSLKHIFAGIGCFMFLRHLRLRVDISG